MTGINARVVAVLAAGLSLFVAGRANAYVLWGNDDHEARAKALAQAVGAEKVSGLSSLPRGSSGIAAVASTDATLTVWGHGDATHFSSLLDSEFGTLIKNWKAKNAKLTTVEIVTCDARHNGDELAGFAKRVAAYLKANSIAVKVKALPVGQHADDKSILWANPGSKSFLYMSAPSTATFDHANGRITTLDGTDAGDLVKVGSTLAKERSLKAPKNFTINYGALTGLRAQLVVVAP